MKYDALIFDLDGTLVNTQHVYFTVHREILATYGYTLNAEVYASTFGKTRSQAVETLLRHTPDGPTPVEYANLYDTKLSQALKEYTDILVTEADTFCQSAYLQGIPLALVTSSPRDVLPQIACIQRILPLFTCIITADDVMEYKPDPEPFLKAVEKLGAKHAFVFEDSLPGALAANRAELSFAIHKHAANQQAARIMNTMEYFEFLFDDYADPRIQALLA